MNNEFIVFGIDEISKEKFVPIKNSLMNKPIHGFWASPYTVESDYPSRWIEWCCLNQYFNDKWIYGGVKFSLKPGTKILWIEDYQDVVDKLIPYYKTESELFPDEHDYSSSTYCCSYTDISKEYDGIFIADDIIYNGLTRYDIRMHTPNYYQGFSVYDVESLCLFNLDCIDENSVEYIDMSHLKDSLRE